MTETRGQYITDTMPWLEIMPQPKKAVPQMYLHAQALLDRVFDDLRFWWSAHIYGDVPSQLDADEQLIVSAGRLIGHLEGLRDDDL